MLPKINRLTLKEDFENVRQNGKFISFDGFSISLLDKKNDSPSRFGFIVSKKVSTKAVIRNKIKRILREVIHKNLKRIKPGCDVVIIAKASIIHIDRDKIRDTLNDYFI